MGIAKKAQSDRYIQIFFNALSLTFSISSNRIDVKILVTGSAGFIGNETCLQLLELGHEVIGIDNLSPYYDVQLKEDRLLRIKDNSNFIDARMNIEDRASIERVFKENRPEVVINLAAQAGVRYSLENPHAYIDTNITGFLNILEGCKVTGCRHLIYSSSSSVYGNNTQLPFSADDSVNHPISLYAATKRSNELMAHVYSHLYGLPCTGLRFFTVYGPWGRPDMALFLFTKSILEGRPIELFNRGQMSRSFTYISDVVRSLIRLIDRVPDKAITHNGLQDIPSLSGSAPFKLHNIGNETVVSLLRYVELLEDELGIKAKKNMLPMQPGDVQTTSADIQSLVEAIEFAPKTSVEEGVANFVSWYRDYYNI